MAVHKQWSRAKLPVVIGAVCATMLTLSGPAAAAQHRAAAQPGTAAPSGTAAAEEEYAATFAALKRFQAAAGPGAAVHAGNSNTAWTLSVGTGTLHADRPIQPDEHFRVGSQTKTFTAAVVLQLADEGKVSLDAAIDDYLPGVVSGNGYDGTRITVRHLLQQTGGLGTYNPHPLGGTPEANPDGTYELAASVRKGLKSPPVGAPGATYNYSNTNYLILGMLIEKLTGQKVHQAVTSRVIEPLGLRRTVFPAPGERALPSPAVNGYHGIRVGGLNLWGPALSYDPSLFSSAGAIVSTLEDISAFYRALTSGKLLSPAGLTEMEKVWRAAPDSTGGYGLGIAQLKLSCGATAWGHNGGLPGYLTMTLVTKDGRFASVVTNANFGINTPLKQLDELLDTALCKDTPKRP
ncbi:beta-lactamase family protein [Streptomyces sp. OF3]|uniref:Beta-lactamase family protein n=1 Tax=Streptomyces alkaliterrae TaxID=2213162 RepID=A0A7W3WNG0_9ACTN|nr:serine hydrolase domain-containing protein [Streptomyces alkaliterrae]MBB1255578.1 beta-lactamase family protein [Streptomyces alkaliterrae]